MKYLVIALAIVLANFIILFVRAAYKAKDDPDVQAASDLRMTLNRYRLYTRLYDEYQEYMDIHGANSKESIDKFKEIFKQIPNPNEWRRYSEYRLKKFSEESRKECMCSE